MPYTILARSLASKGYRDLRAIRPTAVGSGVVCVIIEQAHAAGTCLAIVVLDADPQDRWVVDGSSMRSASLRCPIAMRTAIGRRCQQYSVLETQCCDIRCIG